MERDLMTKTALLVIDVQNDFLPPSGQLAIKNGLDIVQGINEVISNPCWDAIVVSQDWHPTNHSSFASQHDMEVGSELEMNHPLGKLDDSTGNTITMKHTLWPDHCVQNTHGARLESLLEEALANVSVPCCVVKKGYLVDREYYSCFQDVWGLDHTKVNDFLTDHSISKVFVVGLAFDFCVLNLAVDCARSGFETTVIKKLCKSVYPENDPKTNDIYCESGVKVLESVPIEFD